MKTNEAASAKKLVSAWATTVISALLILSLCIAYIFDIPQSSSWFHTEHMTMGDYTVGRIDFMFYNLGYTSVSYEVYSIAPTRYFAAGENRNVPTGNTPAGDNIQDVNFNKAVRNHAVTIANSGDVDILVDLDYDDHDYLNDTLNYYIFVPIEPDDPNYTNNFLTGNYLAYINTLLQGKLLETDAERKEAMEEINREHIKRVKNVFIAKPNSATKTVCYMLYWTEYDAATWNNHTGFTSYSHPFTITAYAHQPQVITP